MDTFGFKYINGFLHCDGIPVSELADRHGTPCYIYSEKILQHRLSAFHDAFRPYDPLVCFSVKSLSNIYILSLIAEAGFGFDIVSGGELYRVLKAGGDPAMTVFAGVGKTPREIEFALRKGTRMFNVESESEMRLIQRLAAGNECIADVAIRVNPDIDPRTHEKTTTGKKENKFGIDMETAFRLAVETKNMNALALRGLHVHLGSPIYDAEPYLQALNIIADMTKRLRNEDIEIDTINLGGGYCMSYTGEEVPAAASYAEGLKPVLEGLGMNLILEPGRHIAAPAGILAMRTIYRKETGCGKKFVITDGAMNDLMRPALYGAFHRIWPVCSRTGMPETIRPGDKSADGFETETVDVVGPVCESSDCMAKQRPMPPVSEGDVLAVFDAGAYGYTMSSNYNGRPRAAEVLVGENGPLLISRRESYQDLIAREMLTGI